MVPCIKVKAADITVISVSTAGNDIGCSGNIFSFEPIHHFHVEHFQNPLLCVKIRFGVFLYYAEVGFVKNGVFFDGSS